MISGTIDKFFGVIWITMLALQIVNLDNIGVMNCPGGDLRRLSAFVIPWSQ